MSATFDANALADTTSNGVLNISASNLTIGAGSNRALAVQLCFSANVSAQTVVWDNGASNQSCTNIISVGTAPKAQQWGLVNPISGAKTLRAAWTTASDVYLNSLSVTGADQTGGTTTFAHGTSANTTATGSDASIVVTSATGNITVATGNTASTSWGVTSTETQTFLDNSAAGISGVGSRGTGAATVTHTWTVLNAFSAYIAVGFDIVASVGVTVTAAQMAGIFSESLSGSVIGRVDA
jgi:hypothetical protein